MKKFFLLWVFLLVSASSVSSVYAAVPNCSFEPLVVTSIGETREQKGTVRLKKFCNTYWQNLTNWSAQNLRIIKAPKEADIITRVYEIGFKFYKLGPTQIIYEIDALDKWGKTGVIRITMNINVVE